jgi:hypothetical protein
VAVGRLGIDHPDVQQHRTLRSIHRFSFVGGGQAGVLAGAIARA